MTTVTFDTHPIIQDLKAVGFDEKQAEALASVVKYGFSAVVNFFNERDIATMQDVKKIEADLAFKLQKNRAETDLEIQRIQLEGNAKIERIHGELKEKIEKTKSSTHLWMFGMLATQSAFMFTVMLTFFGDG